MKFFLLLTLFLNGFLMAGADRVCQKCERIRKENAEKAKDQTWVFYEDWQKQEGDKIQFDEEKEASSSE